jgi:hypothetical protein
LHAIGHVPKYSIIVPLIELSERSFVASYGLGDQGVLVGVGD